MRGHSPGRGGLCLFEMGDAAARPTRDCPLPRRLLDEDIGQLWQVHTTRLGDPHIRDIPLPWA